MESKEKSVKDVNLLQSGDRDMNYYYYRVANIFPRTIMIEPSNGCNASCIFCPSSDSLRPRGFMKFDLCKKIIDEAVTHPEFRTVEFYGLGEPLTDKGIFEKIQYAKEKGLRVNTTTNAGLLDEHRAEELLNSGLDRLKISLDGNTKETYEDIRRNLNFETTCKNVTRFLEMKKELGREKPMVVLRTAYTKNTKHEIESYVVRWRELADAIFIASVANWGGHNKYNNQRIMSGQKPCVRLWNCAMVTWDGFVLFCCYDINNTIEIGNVTRNDLSEIWNTKKMQEIRKIHLESRFSELSLCAECNECCLSENKDALFVSKSNRKIIAINQHNPSDYKEIMDCLTTRLDYLPVDQINFGMV